MRGKKVMGQEGDSNSNSYRSTKNNTKEAKEGIGGQLDRNPGS